MAESTSAMADLDWDAIFEIDFVEESGSEGENSDSEDDGLPINEDEEFEEQQQASNKKPLQVNVVEDIKATSSDKAKKTPKRFVVPTTVAGSQSEEIEMTVVEENILRYAVGFVPFSLKKQCSKRKTRTDEFRQKMKCLSALGVDDELEKSQTFLEYTRSWIEKQNRGGLFQLNDAGYLFFRAVERHCRKFLQQTCVPNNGSSDIRELVLKDIYNDNVALQHWAHATAGQPSSVSLQVLQMCVKLWVTIRGHAFAANWVEKFKQSQCAGKKKALRKDLKDLLDLKDYNSVKAWTKHATSFYNE
ncbi:Hypothetical predicted protein [Paramuricea clavata]|uniref:Uncharacterized protein n=1 Tax=Paramuricea clavata TaxID=317549 RepID=A0A6S7HXC4_PARCT|nr:Hypothetical predicted protein [Paramuricea clavata]